MMKQKKIISLILSVMMLFSIVSVAGISAFAQDDILSYLTYEIIDGEVTITDCADSIRGDVTLPDTIEGYPVTKIGVEAFARLFGISSITLGKNVKSIDDMAFVWCMNLENVQLPEGLDTMGYMVFSGCPKLKEITIPDGVTSLNATFAYNYSLETINLPNNNIEMHEDTFAVCPSLKRLDIPVGVSSLDKLNLTLCDSLTDIYIYNPEFELGELNSGGYMTFGDNMTADDACIINALSVFSELDLVLFYGVYTQDEIDRVKEKYGEDYNLFENIEEADFNVTIHGYAGSTAETIASEYNLKFVPITEEDNESEKPEENFIMSLLKKIIAFFKSIIEMIMNLFN